MSEVETNPIEDLVQHAFDQDFNKANQVFGDLMGQKINDMLDQEKIAVADQIFNGVEPEDDDYDISDDDDVDQQDDTDLELDDEDFEEEEDLDDEEDTEED